ncbi:hypothetical protein CP985_13610 [Malaciobacter mytili LMG 24559]|uniref:DUF3784 domain-containing protein n=2 Tax=Malaciobacter mytili TaxID=603050 RepID=A0AAX2AEZ3_9BACT|nr:putative membrane protein [Malaciobacter mytili LMG 24559]RXK12987.1 hypothetical protein CP985_13610 [Malaciobacter mytili LMG 24559]
MITIELLLNSLILLYCCYLLFNSLWILKLYRQKINILNIYLKNISEKDNMDELLEEEKNIFSATALSPRFIELGSLVVILILISMPQYMWYMILSTIIVLIIEIFYMVYCFKKIKDIENKNKI